jgi:hypothetical protein
MSLNYNTRKIDASAGVTESQTVRLFRFAGAKNGNELVAIADAAGARLGKRDDTRVKNAIKFYAAAYNRAIDDAIDARELQKRVEFLAEERRKIAVAVAASMKKEKERKIRKNEARKKARKAKKADVTEITRTYEQLGRDRVSAAINILYGLRGKTVRWVAQSDVNGTRERVYDVIGEGFQNNFFRHYVWNFAIDSIQDIFHDEQLNPIDGVITFYIGQTPTGVTRIQSFRDGITHCMFTPIRKWAEESHAEAKSKSAVSRYNAILNRLTDLEETYAAGVPEDRLHEVANACCIDIEVDQPFSEEPFIKVDCAKKSIRKFRFMNTRIDHVEHNELVGMSKPIEMSQSTIVAKYKELRASNTFFTFQKKGGIVSKINTLTESYSLKSEYRDAVNAFEEANGIKACRIDDVDDQRLSSFIRDGSNYNGTVDWMHISNEVIDAVKHIDMQRAYANFKTCKQYEGFLGKITDFRQCDKIEGVGLYRITNLSLDGCSDKLREINKKMKIWISNNVYSSPELRMLSAAGATYRVVSGCWGVKPLDIEFTADMLNSKDNGVAYYAKWSGSIDSHELKSRFYVLCNTEYFHSVACHSMADVAHEFKDGVGMFSYNKKHNYHCGHITAFLTSYQRLNVVEQLMEMDITKVARVCVDGIYFLGDMPKLCNVFRAKSDKTFNNTANDSYVSVACVQPLKCPLRCDLRETNDKREHFRTEIHLGEGGCGKTHFNLLDNGLVRPLFVAPSWKLANEKRRHYDAKATVWARLLSDDPDKWRPIVENFNCLIVDETSMLSEGAKQHILSERFAHMKIIFCGDNGYQLPCIEGKPMTLAGIDHVVRHSTDHRCKDEQLRTVKRWLRDLIDQNISVRDMCASVVETFKQIGRCISFDEVKPLYRIDDMILAGTNAEKDRYTSAFEGSFGLREKYYVRETSRLHSNGEIVIGEKPATKCVVQHAFTAHSIQGETAENRLFIHAATMFELRMFYTAVSRARRLEQIFIIV